ncbi:Fe-S cluster assembly protein HesB, partial [cyanobacterium TDX16]
MSDLPLRVTGDDEADRLLAEDPFALVLGMLLDQQVPMEWAFGAPRTLRERLGGSLDPAAIAAMDPDDLIAAFVEKPALHRYPAAMAKRTHDLCQHLVDEYGGSTAALWETAGTADELFRRIKAMPGYGP